MNTMHEGIEGKILFVDDERNILSALKREFLYSNIEVFTAMTAEDAWGILLSRDIDVIVSDYRMPEIDGMQFLQQVKEKCPHIARLVFSGFIDRTVLMSSLTKGYASTFFTKPWNKKALIDKIQRIICIKKKTMESGLFSIINTVFELPTFPYLQQQFLEAINSNQPRGIITNMVNADPVLSTKVLQVANSAFFGEKEISSVKAAIDSLHMTSLEDIARSTKSFEELNWSEKEKKIMIGIYTQSTIINNYLPLFTSKIPSIVRLSEDMGKIVLLHFFPEQFHKVYEHQTAGKSFYKCERELGFEENSHLLIGSYLLDLWNIPGSHFSNDETIGSGVSKSEKLLLEKISGLTLYIMTNEKYSYRDIALFKPTSMNEEEFKHIVKSMIKDFHKVRTDLSTTIRIEPQQNQVDT